MSPVNIDPGRSGAADFHAGHLQPAGWRNRWGRSTRRASPRRLRHSAPACSPRAEFLTQSKQGAGRQPAHVPLRAGPLSGRPAVLLLLQRGPERAHAVGHVRRRPARDLQGRRHGDRRGHDEGRQRYHAGDPLRPRLRALRPRRAPEHVPDAGGLSGAGRPGQRGRCRTVRARGLEPARRPTRSG